MTTGEKLASLRKKSNLTQEQLAEQLGVSRQAISKWESDISFPETEKLIELSNLYECSMDYLLKPDQEYVDESKEEMTFMKQPYFFAFCFAVGVLILNLIIYFFPYAIGSVNVMGQTLNIRANFYQVIGSSDYQLGNVLALFAFFAMMIGAGMGIISTLTHIQFNVVKIRRILSIVETSLWLLTTLMLISAFQIGMLFILIVSCINTWALFKLDKAQVIYQ